MEAISYLEQLLQKTRLAHRSIEDYDREVELQGSKGLWDTTGSSEAKLPFRVIPVPGESLCVVDDPLGSATSAKHGSSPRGCP